MTLSLIVAVLFLALVLTVLCQIYRIGDRNCLITLQQAEIDTITDQRDRALNTVADLRQQRDDACEAAAALTKQPVDQPHPKLDVQPSGPIDSFLNDAFDQPLMPYATGRIYLTDAEVDTRCAALERLLTDDGSDPR